MIMKLAEVLMMLTCVVEVPRARAFVNSVHIYLVNESHIDSVEILTIPLKIRFNAKNIYVFLARIHNIPILPHLQEGILWTAVNAESTGLLAR